MKNKSPNQDIYVYDIEVYPNLFLAIFCNTDTGKRKEFVIDDDQNDRDKLLQFLDTGITVIGYNNYEYDDLIIQSIQKHPKITPSQIKSRSDRMIKGKLHCSTGTEEAGFYKNSQLDSIDLAWLYGIGKTWIKTGGINAPIPGSSLKSIAGRMGFQNIQELPYPPDTKLTAEERFNVIRYCHNDVDVTVALYKELLPEIELRGYINEQYLFLSRYEQTRYC